MQKFSAPNIASKDLWNMTPKEFNSWRRDYDYPRIIEFLKITLTGFTDWMKDQIVSDEELLEFAPAIFLKPNKKIMIYEFEDKNGNINREIRETKNNINEIIFHAKKVLSRKDIIPYFEWVKKNKQCVKEKIEDHFFINIREGRKAYINQTLELVDAGNIKLPTNFSLSGRELEFLNIDDLVITNCHCNSKLRIWYSSAINLTIVGDLAFLDAFKTPFTEAGVEKTHSMKLINGNFQSWCLKECETILQATNSTLLFWKVEGNQFKCTLEHSSIESCNFRESSKNYFKGYRSAANFHQRIKKIYSQLGELSEAGKHYYKEKVFEEKSLIRPGLYFKNEIQKEKRKTFKAMIYVKCYAKYFYLLFQNFLWGFGEKPARVFAWCRIVVIASALLYRFHPKSKTFGCILDSLYFSIVTFTTLGYGEITQSNVLLKLYAAIEALFGLVLMALAIAGFATKSKDY